MKRLSAGIWLTGLAAIALCGAALAQERPSFVVERIEILGNTRTKQEVIIRSMTLKEGDVLTPHRLATSQRDLYRTRLFRSVHVSSRPGSSEGKAIVVVYVDEKRFGDINAGGEYSELDGFTFVTDVRYVNLRGDGKSVGVSYDLGERRRGWGGYYTDPYLFGSRFSLLIDAHASVFERDLYPDAELAFRKAQRLGEPLDPTVTTPDRNGVYRLGRIGGSVGFGRDLGGGYGVIFKYSAEDVDVKWVHAPLVLGPYAQEVQNNRGRDALLLVGVEFRKGLQGPLRKRPQNELSASFDYSPVLLGSVSHFARLKVTAKEHSPLMAGHVLSLGFRAGSILWTPPFYERIFLDGDYQLRGFERRAIGPEGGTKMISVEAVYAFPLWHIGRFYLFGEAANVWVRGQAIKLRPLNGDFGVGVSLLNRIEFSFGFGPRNLIVRMRRLGGISAGV